MPKFAILHVQLRADFGSTGVGAIRLFFGACPSSCSLSLTSLLRPAAGAVPFRGVSGGVVNDTPVTLPEFAAVMPGKLPVIKDGLLTTVPGTAED